ncbi:SPX domain-containing protein [Actinidia chinensis var. chinensis]|uniref:SPX domain-containing protein n=1 Tax=Actinidia chinensis var. chinensis TaxID=1590841 RepID=A0A2R6RYQ0_ACTCC|nr:SPX domain-containing protein [Actinidia chinensis var. chinensis]
MKFGKEFRTHLEETLPEWRDKFLCYKLLKKLLKHVPTAAADDDDASSAVDRSLPPIPSLADLRDWFVRIIGEELEKFNNFFVDKEEEFVIRLQELKERIEWVKEKNKDGVFTSETEFSEETMDIRKDFVTIHGEMVLLKNYSSLNFAGLVKILKKYDKRTGELLQLPFTQLALHQPFFTTEPLTRLVRDCEANLEVLFPLEAEVVQSTTSERDQRNPNPSETTNISAETSSSLGEETVDIYRSTLAAMRTIQGLKRASSTHNSLSFASIFGKQDDENTGAVTAENSPRESLATEPEAKVDGAQSPQ